MIRFFDNIETADRNAMLVHGKHFLEKLEIMEMNKITRCLYENDIDFIIKINQDLELKYVTSKINGDLDPSINGDSMLD